ncbi:MAG: type III-A CRISPR-associated RAMP protein Csm3 [Rubrobacter sp.]
MTRLRAKIVIQGELEVITGLHVGSAAAGMQIGSVDSPVVRDPLSRRPYIPGSSFKGKLRSLLEAAEGKEYNRSGGRDISRHECDSHEDALECEVCRLFGSVGRNGGTNHPARLAVSDLALTEASFEELRTIETGLMYTEWKFENTLDRITSAAMPRQIERVPAGSVFEARLVFDDRDEGRNPD